MERNFNMVVEIYKEHICNFLKNLLKNFFFSKVYFLMTGTCKYEFNEKYYHKKKISHIVYHLEGNQVLNISAQMSRAQCAQMAFLWKIFFKYL